MVAAGSKCRTCRGPAIIDLPRHNANFCAEHFVELCRRQVVKAIEQFEMLTPDDRHARRRVGRQGQPGGVGHADRARLSGRRSLRRLGHRRLQRVVRASYARAFATERGLHLIEVKLRDEYGYDIPTAAKATRRVPCSACGMSKRHLFDKAALDGGYTVLVTGHNLDDEAAVLFGNTLRWDIEYLARQLPVLPARNGFPKKVKPLVRLTERETAAWCIVRGIDYLVDECPMAAGNKHLAYKAALNTIEADITGQQGRVLPELRRQHGAAAGWTRGRRRRCAGRLFALWRADDR